MIQSLPLCAILLCLYLLQIAAVPTDNVKGIRRGGSNGTIALVPFPDFDVVDVKNYVYYSYSAYCEFGNIHRWNCFFCKGDTVGFQTVKVSYDCATDTVAVIGYHLSRKESKSMHIF